MEIVEAWLEDLEQALGAEPLRVADARVGVFFTAAALSTGEVGVAFTPRDLVDTVCCPRSAAAMPRAGELSGAPAWELAREALAPVALRRAVGVAVLNALSARAAETVGLGSARLMPGVDALEAAGVRPSDTVALVGAFAPFLKVLKGRVAGLSVVDKHPGALKDDERPLWCSPEDAGPAIARADVVVATGATLVEGGLESILASARNARCVVLAGPTAPCWPGPFFARRVDVLGGIRVIDGQGLLRVVGEGGSGYLFDGVAEKVCVVRGACGR